MAHRFAVVIDDLDHGPYFLPDADTAMPQIFGSWEEAHDAGQLLIEVADALVAAAVIRLRDS
jgi:hypothetical protein